MQDGGQAADGFGIRGAVAVHLAGEFVGHTPRAHRDAALARALAIAIGVLHVADQLMPIPADFGPSLGRQGHRGDLGRVQGQPVALVPLDPGGEAFGAAQDNRRAHHAAVGGHAPRVVRDHLGAFDNGCALALNRFSQPAHQFCRLHPRHARDHHRAEHARNMDALRHLLRGQFARAMPVTPSAAMGDFLFHALQLRRSGRHHHLFRRDDVSVNSLGRADRRDLGHGRLEILDHLQHRLTRGGGGIGVVLPRKGAHAPPTIAARSAEAREFLFDHQDLEIGLFLHQIPSGPQPGEPRANDRHIDRGVPRKGRTAGFGQAHVGIPKADVTDLHACSPPVMCSRRFRPKPSPPVRPKPMPLQTSVAAPAQYPIRHRRCGQRGRKDAPRRDQAARRPRSRH